MNSDNRDRSACRLAARGHHVGRDRQGSGYSSGSGSTASTCSFIWTLSTSSARPARSIARRQSGEPVGPLAGVPVAIKDVLCVEGEPTTCGSRMLRDVPAALRCDGDQPGSRPAGAILFGKTNMDEFAMGSSTENQRVWPDPESLGRSPGARRLVGRLGRGGGGQPGAAGARYRHRRVDPPAGGRLRHRRAQTHLWPGQPLRPDRIRQLARPDRPVRT